MKLTYGNQTIDLFSFDEPPSRVIYSISGGLDSASLLYLICKHFPEIEIWPVTGRDIYAPFDAECAIDVVIWMQNEFPDANIKEHVVWDFDDLDKDMSKRVTTGDLKHLNVGYNSTRGAVKALTLDQHLLDYYAKLAGITTSLYAGKWDYFGDWSNNGMVIIKGITKNPPIDEMHKYNFYHLAERRRDEKYFKTLKWVKYKPYANVDKKFVSGVINDNNLMSSVFPLTNSCTGTKRQTDYFTKICEECFWCKEKYWAFGQY